MSRLLATVQRAARRRHQAETAYRHAVTAARDHGHTLREIADAAGITISGAAYLLKPDPRKKGGDTP